MITALVVDDELHAREEMQALLEQTNVIEVIGSCSNGIDALKAINTLRPQVLFLDIQMPVISGFELLNMVHQDIMPHVVFVTAYDQYSLQAFEEKTLDYLLKPVDSERLAKTITKLSRTIVEKSEPVYQAEQIHRIPCSFGNRIKLTPLAEVEFVSTDGGGVQINTKDSTCFTEVTLKVLEERTPFLRCHKQFLINLDGVNEIILLDAGRAKIKTHSGKLIPVSRHFLKRIKKKILL